MPTSESAAARSAPRQGNAATVTDTRVNGDIQFESNAGRLRILRNRVDGNIQVFQNSGGVDIRRNTVEGNLQCKTNMPAPAGGNNIVNVNTEDQCRRL